MVHISGGKERQYPLALQTEYWATEGEERSQKIGKMMGEPRRKITLE